MKFYLVKSKTVKFDYASGYEHMEASWSDQVTVFDSSATANIEPVWEIESEREKCSKLKTTLEKFCRSKHAEELAMEISLNVGVGRTPDQIEMGTHVHGFITLDADSFNPLSTILACIWQLSENSATFQVEIQQAQENGSSIITSEMTKLPNIPNKCHDSQIRIPVNWDLTEHPILLTITATIPDEVLNGNQNKNVENPLLHFKYILENEIMWDVTLVANDGTTFKAHKLILASRSKVFERMFTVDMKENQENKVDIPDLCGENLDAFRRYLYYEEESVKEGNIEKILELYQAAHKYHVEKLEHELLKAILSKPMNWFDLDGTVELYALARNLVPVSTDLQGKILQVLKSFATEIMKCPAYLELFQNNKAAMELCQMALQMK